MTDESHESPKACDAAPAETAATAETAAADSFAPAVAPPSAAASEPVAPTATTPEPVAPAASAAAPSAPLHTPARAAARRAGGWARAIAERPESVSEVPRSKLAAQSRRDFLLFAGGTIAAGLGAWWLLPDRARSQLVPGVLHDPLDTLAARTGLTLARREQALDRALTFDDDIAAALYSRDRRVRTYDRSQVTVLHNNYDGMTPGPGYLPQWTLRLSGLASGANESLRIDDLLARFERREQVTRLVCVEGWSAVAWWGGIRFADLLRAYPPAPGMRWAALRSAVNLDGSGRPDPYYVSIDLETARHPQTLLATQHNGRPLTVEHGAPLRLVVPMKLGLKNIKAITEIEYTAAEPRDYWNERGYSKYDGL